MEVVSSFYSMKKFKSLLLEILLVILLIPLLVSNIFISISAEAHKLLESYHNDNTGFESALTIPNYTISWAIYQQLGGEENVQARFYKFNNNEINGNFFAQLNIPKIEKYRAFAPSLILIGPKTKNDNSNNQGLIQSNSATINKSNTSNSTLPFHIPSGYQIIKRVDYQGITPPSIFYEPFTQTSYWERQALKTKLQDAGIYYIVVMNNVDSINKNNEGKFSLAVGEVEDFSLADLFILLPYTWIKVNLFFNGYLRIFVAAIIFVFIVIILPVMVIYMRNRREKIIS
jgi:hypothetical protein